MTGRVYGHLIRRSAIASLSITADEWEASVDTPGNGVNTIRFSAPLELKFRNYMPDYLHELGCGGFLLLSRTDLSP